MSKCNGIVYLITDGKYIKIGFTKGAIKDRINSMQTGNANDLVVIAYGKVQQCEVIERYLHKRYGKYNHNREWFYFQDEKHINTIVGILNKAENQIGYAESLIFEYNNSMVKPKSSTPIMSKKRHDKIQKKIQDRAKRQKRHIEKVKDLSNDKI